MENNLKLTPDSVTNGDEANKITRVDNISAHPDNGYFTLATSGAGDGVVQFWDKSNSKPLVRAREGGHVRIEANANVVGGLSIQDWNIVDMVEAGADPTGSDAIDQILADNAGSNTVLVFPKGTYKLNGVFNHDNFDVFGMVGAPEATIKVANSLADPALFFDGAGSGTRLFIENITVDISKDGLDARPLYAVADERLHVSNFHVKGQRSKAGHSEKGASITTVVTGAAKESGFAYVNLYMPDGGENLGKTDQTSEFIAIGSGGGVNKGVMVYDNCFIQGFLNNGFYVKGHPGEVHVRNSVAKNIGLTSIRLGEAHTAENCRIDIDADQMDRDNPAAQALWGEGGDCTFENIIIHRKSGNERLLGASAHQSVFRDLVVYNEGEGDNFEFKKSGECVLENCRFYDTNTTNEYYSSRIRSGKVILRNVYYSSKKTRSDGSSTNRRGINVSAAAKVVAKECEFDVVRDALTFTDDGTFAIVKDNTFTQGDLNLNGPEGAARDNEFTSDSSLVYNSGGIVRENNYMA